ncbi:MAG TPA: hypothetical protein VHV79_03995 [Mycobacteriales bacterium]|nr:hypothetical protein [Mycobacteriales bacterium]
MHRGSVVVAAHSGKNSVVIDGKLGHGKTLKAGRCNVTITAKNANGTSAAKPVHFTVHAR